MMPETGLERLWFVAHTRARCEKKLVQFCRREKISATLACYKSVRRYRGKTVTFERPLFPGYVFLHTAASLRQKIAQNQYVANVLTVPDQRLFESQLEAVMLSLQTDLEIRLAPHISEGRRVRVKSGALRGVEGFVERRYGMATILLRIDFIGQAAAVKLQADDLELI